MDCTLRDGEQTNGVSFLPHEKLMIARMLLHDINVDRIEVASARVSEGEKDAVARICRYAKTIGKLDSVEVLGFVDNNKSVDWIAECGGHVINLLAKGSYKHCTQQLKMSPRGASRSYQADHRLCFEQEFHRKSLSGGLVERYARQP